MRDVNDAFRPAVFWSLNDILVPERMEFQMDALLGGGLNCGFLHSRVGLVTEYMSDAWMEVLEKCCRALRARGAHAWLYDEDRWPSGYGGGAVTLKHPDLTSKALCLVPEGEVNGEEVVKQLGRTQYNGKAYAFVVMRKINGENPWYLGGSYPDMLDFRSMQVFLHEILDQYADKLSEYFGKELRGVFFDEPCYIQRGKYPCVPFTMDLLQRFQDAYGYSLLENLEQLFFDVGAYHRVRLDYYALVTRRFVDSFTVQYHNWCQKHGLLLTGHYLNEDTLMAQTECIGAAMPHYAHMDVPGIDILGLGNHNLVTVLQLTSVAQQMKKPCICEALGCIGHQSGPQSMKSITDWLNVLGVSLINPHLTLYSMRGERKRDYPPNISWLQPWYSMAKGYFDHVARVCEAVYKGEGCTNVLVIHPISSVWAEMSPLHRKYPTFSIWSPVNPNGRTNFVREVEEFQKPFLDLSTQLCERGVAHHYGDETLLREHAHVEDGHLIVGHQAYDIVIVPPVSVLQGATKALLQEFVHRAGGERLMFVERYPDMSQDEWQVFKQSRFADTVEKAVEYACKRAKKHIFIKNHLTGEPARCVWVQERIVQERWLAFIANTGTDTEDVTLVMPERIPLQAIDTVSGCAYGVVMRPCGHGAEVDVRFAPGGSLLLEESAAQGTPAQLIKSGADFRRPGQFIGVCRPHLRIKNDNLLPLDRVSFRAGSFYAENAPLESLWNAFYQLPEGTPFEAEYRFYVENLPPYAHAMVEMARNLDAIVLNGQEECVEQEAAETGIFDFSFDRVTLRALRKGQNVLFFRGKKCNNIVGMANHRRVSMGEIHRPTELESVYIVGKFRVELHAGSHVLCAYPSAEDAVYGDITQQGYPFYAGALVGEIPIPHNARWMRVEADANTCRISASSVVSEAFLAPYEFDLAPFHAQNAKTVTVELCNSLANAFGPIHLKKRESLNMIGPALMYDLKRYQEEPISFSYGIRRIVFTADT